MSEIRSIDHQTRESTSWLFVDKAVGSTPNTIGFSKKKRESTTLKLGKAIEN